MLRFGSWIGGDRDGNPFVKPETTRMALRLHMREILHEYLRQVEELHGLLTFSRRLIQPTAAFLESLQKDIERHSEILGYHPERFDHEPYRRKLYHHGAAPGAEHPARRRRNRRRDRLPEHPGHTAIRMNRNFLPICDLIRESLMSHGDSYTARGAAHRPDPAGGDFRLSSCYSSTSARNPAVTRKRSSNCCGSFPVSLITATWREAQKIELLADLLAATTGCD